MRDEIEQAFHDGRSEGRALLMPYFVVGHRDPDTFVGCAKAAAESGADMFEMGIPFSDPIMDGPVIQAATNEVLARGQRTADAIALIERVASVTGKPLVAMTYYNLIFRYGLERFARALSDAGVSGAIVPDLSIEDAGDWRNACDAAGIAPVFLAAQTSTDERLEKIGESSRGFVYAASLLGVTGLRDSLGGEARALVDRVRARTSLPVAVGIGVSTAEHARTVAGFADGVIVGTAYVKRVAEAVDPADAVRTFTEDLRAAVRR